MAGITFLVLGRGNASGYGHQVGQFFEPHLYFDSVIILVQ
jgi:hypothetical protein